MSPRVNENYEYEKPDCPVCRENTCVIKAGTRVVAGQVFQQYKCTKCLKTFL